MVVFYGFHGSHLRRCEAPSPTCGRVSHQVGDVTSTYLLIEQLVDHQRHLPPALTQSALFVYAVPRPTEGLADVPLEGLADVPRSPDTPLEDAPPEGEGVDPVVPAPVVDPSLGEVPVPTPVPIPLFPVAPLPGAPALPGATVPAAPPTPLPLPDPAVPLPLPFELTCKLKMSHGAIDQRRLLP